MQIKKIKFLRFFIFAIENPQKKLYSLRKRKAIL